MKKLKICFTGFTSNQCNILKNPPVVTSNYPQAIVDVGRKLGHKVDWRIVEFNEDPRKWDLIIVNGAPCGSFMAVFGTLQAMRLYYDAWQQRVPLIFYFDDWQSYYVYQNAETLLRENGRRIRRKQPGANSDKQFFVTCTLDQINKYFDKIYGGFKYLIDRNYERAAVLISAHPWGDKTIAARWIRVAPERLTWLDAAPVIDCYKYRAPIPKEKKRAWMLAALSDQEQWLKRQGFRWPVDKFGRRRDGVRLATEEDVANETANRWGTLAPEYPQSGSGWFRSRFLYSAWGKSVMYCGASDAKQLGEPFIEARKLRATEQRSDKELRELAHAQAEIIEKHIWSYDEFAAGYERMIKLAFDVSAGKITAPAIIRAEAGAPKMKLAPVEKKPDRPLPVTKEDEPPCEVEPIKEAKQGSLF